MVGKDGGFQCGLFSSGRGQSVSRAEHNSGCGVDEDGEKTHCDLS